MVNLLSETRGDRSGSRPLTKADLVLLAERLEGVRRWVASRPESRPVAAQLRSSALTPDLEDDLSLASLEAALHELALRRNAAQATRTEPTSALAGGRLLVCELEMSIGDGLSEAASLGFFDVDDRPPWDLWLTGHGRGRRDQREEPLACLLAWVPDTLVCHAQAGIDANRCRSLYWPADGDSGLAAQLEAICR